MKKKTKIKPSKRAKKRYIVFETLLDMDVYTARNVILKNALNMLGNNYHKANIIFLKNKYRPLLRRGIVRVNNKFVGDTINALNDGKRIKTIGISGILKKAEKKYFKIAS